MEFRLKRDKRETDCTFGEWLNEANGVEFQTLEPVSPMPAGRFFVTLRYSPSHGYAVPGFHDVPGHDNIELHSGNVAKHTKNCVLPGDRRGPCEADGVVYPHAVLNSRTTFAAFMARVGVPNFKDLRDWDAVREFTLANPDACRFWVTITDAFAEAP